MQPSEEVNKMTLRPSFELGIINIEDFSCIAKGSKTSLILVTKNECTSDRDKLNLNAFQFARKIHQPHVISFICSLYVNPMHIYIAMHGAKWHQSLENKKLCEDYGYMQLPHVHLIL